MARTLVIDGRTVDDSTDAYVIAEIGHNHQGDVEKCMQLFDAAKQAGAHAVKLQKRSNRHLFTPAAYDAAYNSYNAFGDTYGAHREALEFDRAQYLDLQQYAKELGITFFATAFDFASADFLAELDVPAYKLASGDLRTTPLQKYVASLGKPVIFSTGAGSMDDVRRAHDTLVEINDQLCVMQCTAAYPPEFDQLDLRVIDTFRQEFPDTVVGFSSHDSGIAMTTAAYVLGARVMEKHFTLNRALKGTDHPFSLEPVGLRKTVRDLQRVRLALGDGVKRIHEVETGPVVKMGKKIVVARDLPAGHVLTIDDLEFRSPGDGLWPYQVDDVVGRALVRPLASYEALALEDVAAG